MAKKTKKKALVYTLAVSLAVVLVGLWYGTDVFLDRLIEAQVKQLETQGIHITCEKPKMKSFSWSTLGHYRHYSQVRFQKDGHTFLIIPMSTLHTRWLLLGKKRVTISCRGTTKLIQNDTTCVFENLRLIYKGHKKHWWISITSAEGKIMTQETHLALMFENLSLEVHPDDASNYKIGGNTTVALPASVLKKELSGTLALEAHTPSQSPFSVVVIDEYALDCLDTRFFGKGKITTHPKPCHGWIQANVKDWNYQISLLLYLLSLQFQKKSEIKQFLNLLVTQNMKQKPKLTFVFEGPDINILEFPSIHLRLSS
ncbi:hypothetical protein EIL50_02175 [bacterium NHP-B]|nr:hypothetical protein EIL50_02175 [bacterium NHP-B]